MALYVAEINIGHNFWTLRDSVFIFGIYTQLKKSFQKKKPKKKTKKTPQNINVNYIDCVIWPTFLKF